MKIADTILAIDTSCDDTAVAVTCKRRVLSNVLSSQVEIHKKYGGVYPTEAKRAHEEKIGFVLAEAMKRFGKNWNEIDAVAVTYGPGLAPALQVGVAKAKMLCEKYKKPLLAVNHMEGHLLSALAQNSKGKGMVDFDFLDKNNFPILCLLVSGGHTELVVIRGNGDYEVIGRTRDDAGGEAFDKVARMLGLGYPGGEIIELLAKEGDPMAFDFPIPMARDSGLDFSFSGLKTAVMYSLKSLNKVDTTKAVRMGEIVGLNRKIIVDVAASFQRVLIRSLVLKMKRAIEQVKPKSIWLGGGVGANLKLRNELRKLLKAYGLKLYIPYSRKLFADNAVMIGMAGYYMAQRGEFWEDVNSLERVPGLNF